MCVEQIIDPAEQGHAIVEFIVGRDVDDTEAWQWDRALGCRAIEIGRLAEQDHAGGDQQGIVWGPPGRNSSFIARSAKQLRTRVPSVASV